MKLITNVLLLLISQSLSAGESELWITEVMPSTGQIEVTNVGEEFTTTRSLPFCHRFNYATRIPANVTFSAGESKIYTVTFRDPASSDLWLYTPGGFGNGANILNGLQWNTTSSIGRTALATSVSKWDASSASAPAPAAGQSIQLIGSDPFSSTNWTVGPPNLGTFELAAAPIQLTISKNSQEIQLNWTGGNPPFQIQSSDDFAGFSPVGTPTTEREFTTTILSQNKFYRVVSAN